MEEYNCIAQAFRYLGDDSTKKEIFKIAIENEDTEMIKHLLLHLYGFEKNTEFIVQHSSAKLLNWFYQEYISKFDEYSKKVENFQEAIFKFDRADFIQLSKYKFEEECFYSIGRYNSQKILSSLTVINDELLIQGYLCFNHNEEILRHLSLKKPILSLNIFQNQIGSFAVFLAIFNNVLARCDEKKLSSYIVRYKSDNVQIVAWLLNKISISDFVKAAKFNSLSRPRVTDTIRLAINKAKTVEDFEAIVEIFSKSNDNLCKCKGRGYCSNCIKKINYDESTLRQLCFEYSNSCCNKLGIIFSTVKNLEKSTIDFQIFDLFDRTKLFYDSVEEMLIEQISCKHLTNLILSHV
jgi:hypothetical protein